MPEHERTASNVTMKENQLIESWGRGTQRIMDKCKAEGLPAPVYEYKMFFLYLTFSHERINERINGRINERIN